MRVTNSKALMFVALLCGLTAVGCKKSSASSEGSAASAEVALVTGTPNPAGYQWESAPQAGLGALELPKGEDWKKDGNEVSNEKLDITIMVQSQSDVEPASRAEYLSSLIDVNKRDAPKYEMVSRKEGQINQNPAGLIDGKFDNGTAYATRDVVIFAKHAALAVMVRGPVARQAEVQAVADHVALSYK